MSTANDPASAAPSEQQPPSPNEADAAPDADKAEPAPHERPPVRTDDN